MPNPAPTVEVACFGGAHIDLIAKAAAPIVMASSNPGVVKSALGGVALNVARGLAGLNRSVALVGGLGDDSDGHLIKSTLTADGVEMNQTCLSRRYSTGRYVAIEKADGELSLAVSDTEALDKLDEATFNAALHAYANARMWFADANLSPALLTMIADEADRPRLVADAVSVAKSPRLRDLIGTIDVLFCNLAEAQSILASPFPTAREAAERFADANVRSCVITNGANPIGVFDGRRRREIDVPQVQVSSVTGAGDTLVAGTIDGMLSGLGLADAVRAGIDAAGRKIST